MTKPVLPQYVRDLLVKIAVDAGFRGFESNSIDLKAGSNQDDGFFGSLVAVTIDGDRNNDTDHIEPLHLLCKMIPGSQESRNEMNMIEIFKREAFFYQKVFPAFAEFQISKGLNATNGFFGYPKCYACICNVAADQFVIVMEDLRHRQYEMWPKKEPVHRDHVRCVVREMAKFHAVSFALKAEQPELFAEMKGIHDLMGDLMHRSAAYRESVKESHRRAVNMIEHHLPQHAAKFRAIQQNTITLIDAIADGSNFEPYAVLVHGDCWNNNMLFQYARHQQPQQTGTQLLNGRHNHNGRSAVDNHVSCDAENHHRRRPDAMCFVDWQFSNYNSPAWDWLYYIFTATDKLLRDAEYDELLALYHRTLCETIELLGNDAEKLYSFAAMNEQLRIFGAYAYALIPMTIDVALADPGDIVHFDEIITANAAGEAMPSTDSSSANGEVEKVARKDFLNNFGSEATRHAYQRRIVDIAQDLVEMGYITDIIPTTNGSINGHHH